MALSPSTDKILDEFMKYRNQYIALHNQFLTEIDSNKSLSDTLGYFIRFLIRCTTLQHSYHETLVTEVMALNEISGRERSTTKENLESIKITNLQQDSEIANLEERVGEILWDIYKQK